MTQQATQIYYLSYPCQTDHRLRGWDVVYKVSPHDKLPLPNNEDYNNDREFFQEEGVEESFEIDLSDVIGMEVDTKWLLTRKLEMRLKIFRTYNY